MTLRKILVAVDGSEAAGRATALAATLARGLDAELTLMHVADAPFEPPTGTRDLDAAELDARTARELRVASAFARAEARLGGVAAERLREHGDPADAIAGAAERLGFDHIVIGSRGLSPVGESLLGSVSERVLHRAPCPVTIVH
jgi:nucleotide-binding universal stress UspA family protein